MPTALPSPLPTRRDFLRTAATGAVAGPVALAVPGRAAPAGPDTPFPAFARGEVLRTAAEATRPDRLREAARDVPLAGRSDVLVVGAGPAGIGAALAAAVSLRRGRLPHELAWSEIKPS